MFREIIAEISKDDKNNGPYSSKSDFLKSALMVALAKDASIESQLNQTRANLQNVPRTEKVNQFCGLINILKMILTKISLPLINNY